MVEVIGCLFIHFFLRMDNKVVRFVGVAAIVVFIGSLLVPVGSNKILLVIQPQENVCGVVVL